MGASGGGKTTLLSTLSLRLNITGMKITGSQKINGKEYDKAQLKAISAYVMQDDLLHSELTVEQTLKYTAKLRMSKSASKEERASKIKHVVSLMGVEHCLPVIVGNTRIKGISGGERKRVCIAMELLSDPRLLFLDEPTSGLDSGSALSVCHALKNLSAFSNVSVLCTIHQPQKLIFDLFDNVILMRKGQIIYQGATSDSLKFVTGLGYPCPSNRNPADFLLEVISLKREDGSFVVETEREVVVTMDFETSEESNFAHISKLHWFGQFRTLFARNVRLLLHQYQLIIMNIIASVVISIFVGMGAWHKIGTT
jgi:ATP-binding cassette subfamily G (WHITE) protein 2